MNTEIEHKVAVDFETTPVGFFEKKMAKAKTTYEGHPRLARPEILTAFDGANGTLLRDPISNQNISEKILVFHNLSFDWPVSENGVIFSGQPKELHCTRTMAKLLNNVRPAGLKYLGKEILNAKTTSFDDAHRAGGEVFEEYALNDAKFTYALYPIFQNQLACAGLASLYQIERDFLFINLECQKNGFLIDREELKRLQKETREKIQVLNNELGEPGLNCKSSKQVKTLLYKKWGLPFCPNKKGKLPTDKKSVEKLVDYHPKVRTLLNLKNALAELQSYSSYPRFIDPATGAIHPYIDTLGADTGRCTSRFPNMQNLPKEGGIRRAFIARPGHQLVVFDFGQIEPRVIGHFTNPSPFSELFSSAADFYTLFGSKIFHGLEQMPERKVIKQLILAISYGMSKYSVAANLEITADQAQEYIDSIPKAFPEILALKERVLDQARKGGFSEGLLGRRRYVSGLNSANDWERASAARKAFNAVIQGSAATIFKCKLVELRRALPREVRFLIHVHDEVVLECPNHLLKEVYEKTKNALEKKIDWFSIPLVVDGGVGQTWQEAKP